MLLCSELSGDVVQGREARLVKRQRILRVADADQEGKAQVFRRRGWAFCETIVDRDVDIVRWICFYRLDKAVGVVEEGGCYFCEVTEQQQGVPVQEAVGSYFSQ